MPERVRQHILARDAQVKDLETHVTRLGYLVYQYKTALYGKKAERFTPAEQAHLFEDLETAIAETKAGETAVPAQTISR